MEVHSGVGSGLQTTAVVRGNDGCRVAGVQSCVLTSTTTKPQNSVSIHSDSSLCTASDSRLTVTSPRHLQSTYHYRTYRRVALRQRPHFLNTDKKLLTYTYSGVNSRSVGTTAWSIVRDFCLRRTLAQGLEWSQVDSVVATLQY